MKIGYLCHEYPPAPHGGIGTSVQSLARGLAARGHQVLALGTYPDPDTREFQDGAVRVIQLTASPTPRVGWLLDRLRLRRYLRRLAAMGELDLVEAPDWQGGAWPCVGTVPTAVRFNGSAVTFSRLTGRKSPRLARWVERQALKAADGHVAVSRFIARETAVDFGLQADQIPIIPNAVDPDEFRPPAEGSRQEALVVCIGTVTEKKGVFALIRAWPQVVASCPQARLAVVGKDGRDVATGRSMIAVLQEMLPAAVSPTVEFTGAVPRAAVHGWLQRAALAVFPTRVEALPMAWLEAMATATLVVGSCLGPGEEVIEHGRSGLLCDPRNPDELAAQTITCLRDPALRTDLGAAGRRRVEEQFSTQKVLPQNEAFYQSLLRNRSPGTAA